MSTLVTPPVVSQPVAAPAPPVPAPAPAYPRPFDWTADEFDRVNASGIWEGRRPFLIDGVVWEQGPMNPPHAIALSLVLRALTLACPADQHVRAQQPLRVGTRNDPLPDFAVVPGDIVDYLGAHPTRALLVVEVSDTTLFFDLTTKAEVYATAGVPAYWVVDLDNRRLYVFADPQPLPGGGAAYRSRAELRDADAVTGPGGRAVGVASLLPPAG